MPYQGTLVSIPEMFDELVAHGRKRLDAAVELQHALADEAIVVFFNDAPLTPSQRNNIGEMLRAFVIDHLEAKQRFLWAADIYNHGYALRIQFEAACGLSTPHSDDPRLTAEKACEALILRLKKEPRRMTKVEVHTRAKADIPDLTEKEFDRAWRAVAGDWMVGGRPRKTLN